MVVTLKRGATLDMINKLNKKLSERPSRKGLNAQKFCGVVKFKEDGLALQKRLRDEWE